MNGVIRGMFVVAALGATLGQVSAAPLNFNVLCEKKRFDVERSETTSTKVSKEKWGYGVTIENKAFKALENLEVEYRQFRKDDARRGGASLKAVPGSTKIAAIANGAKVKFDTEPVEIEKEELKANWSAARGSKEKVKDELSGIWIRIMKDGEKVFEYQSPPDLKNKVKWE